ncbi:E2 domain-containing protein [Kordiimonas gwangyangensis]|uniref:E2 domain-containing protein n=1 Tax=Kordiimonas gwangyangensis TaxID=288022 RepID=UPI000399F025
MTSISFLQNAAPPWVSALERGEKGLSFRAAPPKPSGASTRQYSLVISETSGGKVAVREGEGERLLPKCCPERHINPGGSFCIFLSSTAAILGPEPAVDWWKSLGDFLVNQDYANKHRRWPITAQLSHGSAAELQLKMEAIADRLGWRDEILSGIFRHQGWLGGKLPKLRKKTSKLVNGRAPCPRECHQLHSPFKKHSCGIQKCAGNCYKSHRHKLRRACPHRSDIEQLIILESERRRLDTEFTKSLRKDNYSCCGTMAYCPLADEDNGREERS